MGAPALVARHLAVARGRRYVVDDVSIHAAPGEVVGLIGPNGAGKSTLLRALAGVLTPDGGDVEVVGLDVATTPPVVLARALAMVEQTPQISFSFPVRDLVLMGRHAHLRRFQLEGPVDHRAADEALALVGLTPFADRDVTTLSGGERQLASIARAIAQQPQVLLLDEPTSALDLGHQVHVLDLVAHIAADGVAVLVAVHDLDLAARLCDRLVLLVDGRVLAEGRPEEVLTPPRLQEAYGVLAVVRRSPETTAPTVTALELCSPTPLDDPVPTGGPR